MKMRKWRLLCAGFAAAGAFMMGMPGQSTNVAEAMYSAKDAGHHWYKVPSEDQMAFMVAASNGDYDMVKSFIDAGIDVNGVYKTRDGGYTAFYAAYIKDHRDIMQLLLENGADVNGFYWYNGTYCSYLLTECGRWEPSLETIQYLVNWGADVNITNDFGNALENFIGNMIDSSDFGATSRLDDGEHLEIARYLLDKGSDPNIKDKKWGENAFISSISGHYKRIVSMPGRWYSMAQLLFDYGADYTARDRNGKNALQIALDDNDLKLYKMVKAMMDSGRQPSESQPSAETVEQAKVDRGTSLGKFVDLYKKYSDASDKIYNELEAALADTSTGVTKEKLSKEKDAIKQLKKLNEKMAKENPLKGFKGYSVGEREKFTDLFDGLTEYNDAMIALLEYVVVHPTDGDHDQLVNLTAQVIKAQGYQKDRLAAVQEIIQQQ